MICALAFISLNHQYGKYNISNTDGMKMNIQSDKDTNLIIFLKEVCESNPEVRGNITIA
jgi:hypothetical protein